MKRLILGIISVLCMSADAKDTEMNITSSYSAEFVTYNEMNADRKETMKVVMTPFGVKVTSSDMHGQGKPGTYIQNFEDLSTWMVDKSKRTYTKLPQEDMKESEKLSGGVMATKPCLGPKETMPEKKAIEVKEFDGDKVLVWACNFQGYETVQYFSEKHRVVTKEVTENKDVYELKNIKEVELSKAFFMPPATYREVSLKEMIVGVPDLKKYESGEKKELPAL